MGLKQIIKKIVYPNKYSGEAYIEFCRRGGALIGENVTVYNALNSIIDETSLPFISIGNNVQITGGVTILAHDYSYSVLGNVYGELPRQQRMTRIGDNVFIGMNSTILMGAYVGSNVIIGAGSVVSGQIPDNTVCAGNPARVIYTLDEYLTRSRKRFKESAVCYYRGIKRRKEKVESSDMIIYQSLFSDKASMSKVLQSGNFKGLEEPKKIDMTVYKCFDNFTSFEKEIL